MRNCWMTIYYPKQGIFSGWEDGCYESPIGYKAIHGCQARSDVFYTCGCKWLHHQLEAVRGKFASGRGLSLPQGDITGQKKIPGVWRPHLLWQRLHKVPFTWANRDLRIAGHTCKGELVFHSLRKMLWSKGDQEAWFTGLGIDTREVCICTNIHPL